MVDVIQNNRVPEPNAGGMGKGETGTRFKVTTSRFGEIEVDPERVISLTSPILGFPDSKRFVLRPHGPESPFLWFQSLENPDLAFVVVPSGMVDTSYRPRIPEPDREELDLAVGEGPDFFLILTLSGEEELKITANLLGPLALNVAKRLAKQVLLDSAQYDIGFPVE